MSENPKMHKISERKQKGTFSNKSNKQTLEASKTEREGQEEHQLVGIYIRCPRF